jgi:hypothetical protein
VRNSGKPAVAYDRAGVPRQCFADSKPCWWLAATWRWIIGSRRTPSEASPCRDNGNFAVSKGDSGMTKRSLAVITIAMIFGMLTGCAKQPSLYGIPLDAVSIDGAGTLGLSQTGQRVRGVVVYFHGSDQTARVIEDDRRHTDLFDPLLRAGYAVVSADAGGNSFGNPAAQKAYRSLLTAAERKYGAQPVFFVAESMGALSALALIREDTRGQIKAMVGISPLMGMPPEVRSVSYVAGPWGGDVPDSADPLTWPPESFGGRTFRLYASKSDKVIPSIASAWAFADRFGSVAAITVVGCPGGHVALACYQGAEIESWISGLGGDRAFRAPVRR